MTIKTRFDVIASSLSSYFGVGFNTVQEQLEYDLGLAENIVDDEAQDRMNLGIAMEDGCLNYFEQKMGIKIDERNSEYKYACDGKLKCKRDGRTFLEGVETGWENKYSNSSSGPFTEDLGYQIQCQAYMMAWELDQWMLAGIHCGKPISKLIKADKELQEDITKIVDAVVEIEMGLREIEDYPWDIVEKYSSQRQLKVLSDEELEDYDKDLLNSIGKLKQKKKVIEDKLKELEEYAKNHFEDSKWEDADFRYTISTSEGKASFDKNTFSIENPTIDIMKYYTKGSSFKTIRCTAKKKGN